MDGPPLTDLISFDFEDNPNRTRSFPVNYSLSSLNLYSLQFAFSNLSLQQKINHFDAPQILGDVINNNSTAAAAAQEERNQMKPKPLWALSVFFFSCLSLSSRALSTQQDPLKSIFGSQNLGLFNFTNGVVGEAQAPGPAGVDQPYTLLLLAPKRTRRPDILRRLHKYTGGWNITNIHYWASVGFTGAAGFILAALWFILFGITLAVYHCCGWKTNKPKGSANSQKIWLIMLVIFTFASVVGCIVLSVGQDRFHSEAMQTLNYVVNQSDYTVQTLRNVTEYLSFAKTINLSRFNLPSDIEADIDEMSVELTSAAQTLTQKTDENSIKIKKVFSIVRSALIFVAIIMLLLALLGLGLSLLGNRHAIHVFILGGWLLVAATFILCGVFIIFNSVIGDTCTAMREWADNPQAETALSDILPCVDERTTNRTLLESKKVVAGVVNVINQFIYTYADTDRPRGDFFYYNQSGPLLPPLCYPFDDHMEDRQCGQEGVSMMNASLVWETYICATENDTCVGTGRLTPVMYEELVTAVNVSYTIQHYTPPMLSLQNCNFVRDTFVKMASSYCPPLEQYLQVVNAGLGLISVGIMLCLVLWILSADRPQREDVFASLSSISVVRDSKRGSEHRINYDGNSNRPSPVSSPPGSTV